MEVIPRTGLKFMLLGWHIAYRLITLSTSSPLQVVALVVGVI
jgi:hypothetical protein